MKRANHQGSITKTPSGRHWVRITHPDKRRESLGTYRELEEAEAILRGATDLLAAGRAAPAHQTSILTFEDRYFRLRALRTRDKQAAQERNRYKVHLRPAPFAAQPMGTVLTLAIQRWVDSLAETPAADKRGARSLAHETIKKILRLARSVFRYALKDGLIEANPCTRDIELPAPDELLDEPWDFLRAAEQTSLLTCLDITEEARLWIAFAMGTGLRPSELKRLQLVDVDVAGDATVVRVRKTKTNRPRIVPLFGLALSAARRWLELLPSFAPKNPHGLFWPRPRGGKRSGLGLPRPSLKGVQQYEHEVWRGYLRAAGIARDLRWYDATRHTCATSLLCGFWGPRWALVDVSKVLGHKSIKTTERYAHVADDVLRQAGAATTAAALVETFLRTDRVGYAVGGGDPKTLRATQDSNLRPSASETISLAREVAVLGASGNQRQADPVEVLRALARGDGEAARAGGRALAEQVLASAVVVAAVEVLRGGEHVDRRIAELCERVLEAGDLAVTKRGAA